MEFIQWCNSVWYLTLSCFSPVVSYFNCCVSARGVYLQYINCKLSRFCYLGKHSHWTDQMAGFIQPSYCNVTSEFLIGLIGISRLYYCLFLWSVITMKMWQTKKNEWILDISIYEREPDKYENLNTGHRADDNNKTQDTVQTIIIKRRTPCRR